VIEHAIEQDVQSSFVRRCNQAIEVLVVAEAGIDAEVVDGVVSMGFGDEDRPQCQARAAEFGRVVEPGFEPVEPMADRAMQLARGLFCGEETEGIEVPPDGFV
jgi:hypothetical protein